MEIVRWSGDAPWWLRAVVMVDVEEESCDALAILAQAGPTILVARESIPLQRVGWLVIAMASARNSVVQNLMLSSMQQGRP
jgi:hypothetical protein